MIGMNGLLEKQNELYERLDNLEGLNDNPVYMEQVREIREEISEIMQFIRDYPREAEEYERERIEELEERQHQSGFYAFQDMMEMRRFER